MKVESVLQAWQRNPADLDVLSRWLNEQQAQSRQSEALEQMKMLAEQPMTDDVAVGVYSALVTLELDQSHLPEANEWVERLNGVEPGGYRVPYFRGRILQQLNRLEEANPYFIESATREPRNADAWKRLLDCCSLTRDHQRALQMVTQVRQLPWAAGWKRLWGYRQGCLYQQMAEFSLALVCFVEVILDCAANGIPSQPIGNKPRLEQVPASVPLAALTEAVDLLEARGLQPFPTAGTLLGWWREGKFLGHDKDIDLMLPPGDDWQEGFEVLATSPAFAVGPNEMGYSNFRSLIHRATGLVVDLSHHERTPDEKAQCVWRIPGLPDESCRRTLQSEYKLVRDQWLGRDFWRPEDPDHFLTELYGDWRTPQIYFDTTVSGLHVAGFPDVVRCYAYNRLASALSRGDRDRSLAYVQQLLVKDPFDPVANRLKNLSSSQGEGAGDA